MGCRTLSRIALAERSDGVPAPIPDTASEPDVSGLSRLGLSKHDRLERVLAAGLIERRSVFVLSLAPIREQWGLKWEARKEQIWERTERSLSARLPVEDMRLRIDDVSIVVAVASCPAYEAQVRCVSVLREIVTHFLGRANDDDIRLSRVTSVSGDDLIGRAIDVSVPPGRRRPPAALGGTIAPADTEGSPPKLSGRTYAAPFASRGDDIDMKLQIVPVWCLRRGLISSYALRRTFPRLQQPAIDYDQEASDVQTVLRMVETLREFQQSGCAFALHVPLHFATAASRHSRVGLLGLCADILPLMRQVVIFELETVDSGLSFRRLQEAVSMCAPFARAIMIGVREGVRLSPCLSGCGFSGVAIAARAAPPTLSGLRHLIARSRQLTPNVVVHDVDAGTGVESHLARLGASHMTAATAARRGGLRTQ